ncbi:MAG: tetratricopeptide repeat protein [Waddliaceae bacterium]
MRILLFFTILSTVFHCADASYKIREGQLVPLKDLPYLPIEEHYSCGIAAFNERNYAVAIPHFHLTSVNDLQGTKGQDSVYYLGLIYYSMGELDIANDYFSQYLHLPNSTRFFYDAVNYKFTIAEKFRNGAKRRMYAAKQLPKWLSGKNHAIEIYTELSCIVPTSEIATYSLYYKGCVLNECRQYREAIESFQSLISRFPLHDLAPESYLMISQCYQNQAVSEPQNPDIVELAKVSLKHFRQEFPQDPRIEGVARDVDTIYETYANGLYQTAQFYERTGEPFAAILYYQRAILQYPETKVAALCCQNLSKLSPLAYQDVITKLQNDNQQITIDETHTEIQFGEDWEKVFNLKSTKS